MSVKSKIKTDKSDFNRLNNLLSVNNGKNSSAISNSIIQTVIKSSKLVCIATDVNGTIQLFNQGAELKLGYNSDEVINKLSIISFCSEQELISRAVSLSKEFETEIEADFSAINSKALRNSVDQFPLTFIGKNNNHLHFDLTVTTQQDSDYNIIGFIIIGTETNTADFKDILDKEVDKKIITYIENAPLGIFVVDEAGNYIVVNKAASDISGYSRADLLQMNRTQILHPADPANTIESFQELLQSGYAIIDARIITKEGEERYWRINIIKIEGERYMGFVNDITDQKEAQNKLQKTNKYLETIVENIPNMLFLKDAKDLTFVQFNKAGEELTGYTRDQMLGKNDFDFFPKEQAEFFRNKDMEVLRGKDFMFIEEEKILTQNKGERILHTKKVPVFDTEGKPEYLLGISEDITERKNTEQEFLQKKQELDNFFSLSPNFLCIANLDLSFTRLNAVWEELLGYKLEELFNFNLLDLIHPDDLEDTKIALSTLTTEQPLTNYRNRFKCYDGSYIWIEWHIVSTGKQIYAIGSDITKKIYYEVELKKSKEAAEEANRAKSDFLANMSHEIRNPLNAIIGFSELLHKNIKDEKLLMQVTSIRNSGKTLLGLLNDILDLSKIEAGKMKLELEPVNLNYLIKDVENIFSDRVQKKGLSFCVEQDQDLTYKLMLDEVRLRQILFNIIGNAVKFTEKGHICIYINKIYKNDDYIDLTISVEDTGIGIPEEQQQLIFESFQQQDGQSTKKYGGTGLGLSISKRLVEMMGGKISVISEPDKGSTFKIFLSGIKVMHTDESSSNENDFDPYAFDFGNSTVLIADDSELNLDLITMTLENSNLILLTARNGNEAFEMSYKHHPDLILMDLRMPIMNGYEATQLIKNEPLTNSIPIIAISASTDSIAKSNQSNPLFDGFLLKPFRFNDLFELMKKFLPYRMIEKVSSSEKAEEPITRISDEQKYQFNDVIHILETDFLPINESVIKRQLIDQIGDFGKALVLFGEGNSMKILSDYGNKICTHVDNFEIEKMMKTLKLFPDIIEKIKSMAKPNDT
jgi:PAS domain S-box-containing protein